MPRKRVNPQEPPRKRNRTGCNKCRSRKVRCDEQKPVCGQCRAKGFDCETSIKLKWEQDYTSAGRAFGRSGLWSKKAAERSDASSPCIHVTEDEVSWIQIPLITSYSFVNATVGNVEQLTTLENLALEATPVLDVIRTNDRDDTSSTASLSPWLSARQPVFLPRQHSIPSALPMLPDLPSPMHSNLLSYYLEKICPITVPSSVNKSPFANLILPFSISSSPAVLEALLALAACHRSKKDIAFRSTSLRLGDNVLRTLRGRLGTEDPLKVAMDPETLVIMMILCQYEIINECDKRWVVHLKGARDLIRVRRNAQLYLTAGQSSNELVEFSEKYFAFQDVIGRTACGEEPIFGSDFWTSQGENTDAWLGCSAGLVSILCEVTELSRQRRSRPGISLLPDFQYQAASLERRLCSLRQRVFGEEDDLLQLSAELKRLAAELYLHCALNGATPAMPLVVGHVQQVLRLVSVLLEHGVLAGLSWPLFVAAVELDPMEDLEWAERQDLPDEVPNYARPFVLYTLDRLGGSNAIANIAKTRSVIERVWLIRSHDEISDSQAEGLEKGQNDWERYVAPLCGGLSLA
ncbi:C6 transcription factor, partial [Aureobasidium melanogenum]